MSRLTLAQANKIIESALAVARQGGYRAMAVVVLDEGGHVRAVQREDGASMFRIDIATGKAWGISVSEIPADSTSPGGRGRDFVGVQPPSGCMTPPATSNGLVIRPSPILPACRDLSVLVQWVARHLLLHRI